MNVLEGISKNLFFPIILGIIIAFQAIVVTFGGRTFHCFSYYGLNIQQWLITIGMGMTVLIVDFFIKFIPEEKIFTCSLYDNAEKDEDEKEGDDADSKEEEGAPLN